MKLSLSFFFGGGELYQFESWGIWIIICQQPCCAQIFGVEETIDQGCEGNWL